MRHRSVRVLLGLMIVALSAACGDSNPDSTSPSAASPSLQGPHPYDHYPAISDVWVQNADVVTTREYWTIFRQEDGTHYIIPRPDGSPFLADACTLDDELAALLQDAAVCQTASTQAQVQRVNALDLEEALAISTHLHAELTFTASPNGVAPFALISDRVRVCRALIEPGVLADMCAWHLARAESVDAGQPVTEIARGMTPEEARALAEELNMVYGT